MLIIINEKVILIGHPFDVPIPFDPNFNNRIYKRDDLIIKTH